MGLREQLTELIDWLGSCQYRGSYVVIGQPLTNLTKSTKFYDCPKSFWSLWLGVSWNQIPFFSASLGVCFCWSWLAPRFLYYLWGDSERLGIWLWLLGQFWPGVVYHVPSLYSRATWLVVEINGWTEIFTPRKLQKSYSFKLERMTAKPMFRRLGRWVSFS